MGNENLSLLGIFLRRSAIPNTAQEGH